MTAKQLLEEPLWFTSELDHTNIQRGQLFRFAQRKGEANEGPSKLLVVVVVVDLFEPIYIYWASVICLALREKSAILGRLKEAGGEWTVRAKEIGK